MAMTSITRRPPRLWSWSFLYLRHAVHIGHGLAGGEVARYVARY